MDTETAIREIEDRIELESRYRFPADLAPDYIEAFEMAIDALRKQEQVRPKKCHIEAMRLGRIDGMDTETAIKEIKNRIELESRYRIDVTPDYIEALEMAIDALQKQEPVKPKKCHIEAMYHGWHYGPVRTKALVHYCPNCGQKLDWSEE